MLNNTKNQPRFINGDTVVGFTNSKGIKDMRWADRASLSSWYEEKPEKNHLGLVELFTNMANVSLPIYKNFFEKGAVIEVNGMDGKFTYDLPVEKSTGCYTMVDSSTESDAHGIDGSVFPIFLNKPMSNGDVLTYDAHYGEQCIVSEDYQVVMTAPDVWRHMVKLVDSQDPEAYYPAEQLKEGIQYFKVGHIMGEYSTQLSGITSMDDMGTLTCEFILGNHRGVETSSTLYADKKSMSSENVSAVTAKHLESFKNQMKSFGKGADGKDLDAFFVANGNREKQEVNGDTTRIGSLLEYFALLELMKIESYQLLFQKGALINDINGTKRANEGIWHQIRRGTIIEYSRKGGITRSHIRQVMAYLFHARKDMMPDQRRMTFKCGYMAFLNMLRIFREEVLAQIEGLAPLLGTDRSLPSSPVKGTDLGSLTLERVMFKEVFIPEIGLVKIEHDPSLDYQPLTDRHASGNFGDGYAWTSYSMVIWDAASEEFSNARTNLPSGTTLVENGTDNANIYMVKPEGVNMWWGYENGRYGGDTAAGIMAANKLMNRGFFAHSVSAGFVRDISRFITIELKEESFKKS